ncbi:periplasmic iron-binding protein [Primorskyibacter flagellatus]|uniref:Periplasmic iron-binding protein n=1 Tax=Primorskyibacter flagellatus TaxID=1387277 RepID=A0A917A5X4_9RHOB|nr:ABC transporter substrate-binding protein [Primorskyibacter flagellatus]GGE29290.1 periplasmic iron-binding protein [Primorskyibacter flagellatus]
MIRFLQAVLLLLPLTSPAPAQEAVTRFGDGETEILVRSTTDIGIFRPVMERFAELNPHLAISYEQWGSNALFDRSRDDCRGRGPQADAILSSAVQQMVWLANAACAHPHRSAATLALPATRRWRDELWGVTIEPAVIAYNKTLVKGDDIPRSRFALLDAMRNRPRFFRSRIATYDIAESGLGYLFAHSDSLEATTFGALLEGFSRVDAIATCCSAEIIAGVAEGRFVIAYNVLGSYILNSGAPEVGLIMPEDYTLLLSRAYMIPRGAAQKAEAIDFLEFLLTPEARSLLSRAGLFSELEVGETGLSGSALRFIPLSPTLLVARDANRRTLLLDFWNETFQRDVSP